MITITKKSNPLERERWCEEHGLSREWSLLHVDELNKINDGIKKIQKARDDLYEAMQTAIIKFEKKDHIHGTNALERAEKLRLALDNAINQKAAELIQKKLTMDNIQKMDNDENQRNN